MAEPVLAGIPAGGLKEGHEIKVLICYLLVSAGGALRWEEICEVCCGEGLVDYFSLSTATQELERYGNILSLVGERGLVYQITGFGEETVKSLGKTLPASLRSLLTCMERNWLHVCAERRKSRPRSARKEAAFR